MENKKKKFSLNGDLFEEPYHEDIHHGHGIYFDEEKNFVGVYSDGNDFMEGLELCLSISSSKIFYMPELVDLRINSPKNSAIWNFQLGFTTPSLEVIGESRQGNTVVVYVHLPNYFLKRDNRIDVTQQRKFCELLDLEDGERVFVTDFNNLEKLGSGEINMPIEKAKECILPKLFLGGERRAVQYLEALKNIYGYSTVNIINYNRFHRCEYPIVNLLQIGEKRSIGNIVGKNDYTFFLGSLKELPINYGDLKTIHNFQWYD